MLLLHESRYKRLAAATDCLSLSQSIAARVSQVERETRDDGCATVEGPSLSQTRSQQSVSVSHVSLSLSLSRPMISLSQSVAGERVCVCGEEDCGLMVAIRETSIQQDI